MRDESIAKAASNARKAADDALSIALLLGEQCDEREGRKALARRVRDAMNGFSGELLALAIDPETKSRFIGMTAGRRIRFESVRRGQRTQWRRNLKVADFLRRQLHQTDQMESAYAAAMAEFRISRATAQAIWKWHQEAMTDARARNLTNPDASK